MHRDALPSQESTINECIVISAQIESDSFDEDVLEVSVIGSCRTLGDAEITEPQLLVIESHGTLRGTKSTLLVRILWIDGMHRNW